MESIDIQYHKTRIGELILGSFDGSLCLLDYRYRKMRASVDKRIRQGLKAEFSGKDNQLLSNVRGQIEQYLDGDRKYFDIPFIVVGTDFQQSVWRALMEIPYGETTSYSDLAKSIGKDKAARAVAAANGANAMSLLIPCHRVIGSKGELVGYGGGLPVKKHLLEIERDKLNCNGNESLEEQALLL